MRCPTARPGPSPRGAVTVVALLGAVTASALSAAGCSAPEGGGPSVVRIEAPEWVGLAAAGWNRESEPCVFFATGRAHADRDAAAAEARARDAALETVDAFVDAAVAQLDAVFAAQAAGVLDPAALAAVRSDTGLRRQLADGARSAARVQGKWQDDDNFCVWIRLDAQAGLLDAYEQALARKLDGQARELLPADRQQLREELERVVAERNTPR